MSDADTPRLRQANENPWYCLATLYGEQPDASSWDRELYEKNRVAWNRWMASALSEKGRAYLVEKGFPKPELVPFSDEEQDRLLGAFQSRSGREEVPPNPKNKIDFKHTSFERIIDFDNYLFVGDVDFTSAKFADDANFRSVVFFRNASFGRATFSGSADFSSARFFNLAGFTSTTFSNNAFFSSATFSDAFFSSAVFSEYAVFRSAIFSDRADFDAATFSLWVDFNEATFSGYTSFQGTRFRSMATFTNARFTASTVFAWADFYRHVPDFRGAQLHEATEWHDVSWPLAPPSKDIAQDQVYGYERLKQEMERLKKHEDEQSFFRKELRARRGLVSRWSGAWLLNYIYEVLSGYGQSILRPTLWLLALFLFGFAVFARLPVFEEARMAVRPAAALSFANIFSFLPIKREIMTTPMIEGLSSLAQIVGVVQSLLGIVLLFLLGLALRSRFRMR